MVSLQGDVQSRVARRLRPPTRGYATGCGRGLSIHRIGGQPSWPWVTEIRSNCCELLPTEESYCKLFPDQTELDAGILPGTQQKVFELGGKRFKIAICYDLAHMDKIPTGGLDFLLWIYHFTEDNSPRRIQMARDVSRSRGLPVLVSSLVSDKNNGFSSFVDGDVVVSLPRQEGILEVEIE